MYEGLTLAHNIGEHKHSNYHTREQIQMTSSPIGFDGIYRNVYENMDVLEGKRGIFFVMGNYIGGDNTFDLNYVPQLEKYCSWDEINEMVDKYDFEIGWHTWSHPDLTQISNEQLIKEVTPPFPIKYFAYPYGLYNENVIEAVKKAGFQYAWSVTQGSTNKNEDNYRYKIFRNYI